MMIIFMEKRGQTMNRFLTDTEGINIFVDTSACVDATSFALMYGMNIKYSLTLDNNFFYSWFYNTVSFYY